MSTKKSVGRDHGSLLRQQACNAQPTSLTRLHQHLGWYSVRKFVGEQQYLNVCIYLHFIVKSLPKFHHTSVWIQDDVCGFNTILFKRVPVTGSVFFSKEMN